MPILPLPQFEADHQMQIRAGLADRGALVRGHARGAQLRAEREFVLLGDINIAHKEADLKNWRSNQKNSGFLPEERAWFDSILGPRTLVDVVRRLHPDAEGPYSWWSWMGNAFTNDTGWRIDYQFITPGLRDRLRSCSIYRDERFSDHAPFIVDYDL